jgi:hypothetical protein
MPSSWNQLKQSGFDRTPYRECDRFGTWEATVDALAYSHGSRMTVSGRGKRAGIHVYVQALDGEKFWLYAIYRSDSLANHQAKDLQVGDRIRVETVRTNGGHAWVKSLEKLG